MTKTGKYINAAASLVLGLWILSVLPLLGAEVNAWGLIPRLLSTGADTRLVLAGGDIYAVAERAAKVIPPDSSVLFFSPESEGAVGHFSGRIKYRLYPRPVRVIEPEDKVAAGTFRDADYIIIYRQGGLEDARGADAGMRSLAGVVAIEEVDAWLEEEGFAIVYRVRSGKG